MGAGTASILSNPIEYLKGVGPPRADLLKKELDIFTFRDLLELFPYRHIDKTVVTPISEAIMRADFVQVAGRLGNPEIVGDKKAKRLSATITDPTGSLDLIWFQGINWIQKMLEDGRGYRIFGKVGFFNGHAQVTHPEIELIVPDNDQPKHLEPVYPSTEKLKARGLGGRQIAKLVQSLFVMLRQSDLPENLPENLIQKHQLISRYTAFLHIHFPPNPAAFEAALRRLKFEELFIGQLRMGMLRQQRHRFSTGVVFTQVGRFFNEFYEYHLPFELTNAQKKVIKEIRKDMGNGRQMNRLLQGDVGSGKTMVALLCLLLAADNGYQGCLMAPTEILARQHYQNISQMLQSMDLQVRLLTGSVKSAARKKILAELKDGVVDLLIGTHALIEDTVEFKQLGL
ncbi:MAG TPA: DEAD/DEAH box helicase, partial [Flavitalea sp.]|nr:DEAD/DEAH box helicase [Flavitalea sp.]